MALNLISAIAFFWVPESPRYLYGINDLEKCSQVLAYIAKMNGVQDYSAPKFEVEFDIQVENVDETKDTQRKSKTGFDGLLEKRGDQALSKSGKVAANVSPETSGDDALVRQTHALGRYRTVAQSDSDQRDGTNMSINRLTKRESVALMHATVTGIRQTTNWWVIGADRTQSIALDEAFSKGNQGEIVQRETVTLRNTHSHQKIQSSMPSQGSDDEELDE